MKSKVLTMNVRFVNRVSKSKSRWSSNLHFYVEIVSILLCLSVVKGSPTFGDEFVHIKVHLPKEGGAHGPPILSHPIGHHGPVVTPPKVVHHYHKRRRPGKKSPFGKHSGLLESILLSELKKPISGDHYKYLSHAEDIANHVDTFVVKPEKPKAHVDTYTVVEETKPKETIETYKVIESKLPQQHHHHHHLDTSSHGDFDDEGYHYRPKSKPHVEAYKVIDNLFDDYHSHMKHHEHDYGYASPKKQRIKSVKIIDSHDHDHEHDHGYAGHDYGAPHQHSHEYSINFDERPHRESVEIVKTNSPAKSNSYYSRHKPHKSPSPGYHYEAPSYNGGGGNSQENGYDYRPHKYQDAYSSAPEAHYTQEPPHYSQTDSYLPPAHHNNDYQNHYSSGVRQNTVYEDEAPSPGGTVPTPTDSYLPPPLPTLPAHEEPTGDEQWPAYDSTYKATETYTGIDSYSAAHVQGFGSGGYKYPSPYAK